MTAVDTGATEEALVRRMLVETAVIAVIGASPRRWRPAYDVMGFMQARGYRTLPVNAAALGQTIHDESVYANLADVETPVQLVNIFRNSSVAGEAVDAAIAERARLGIRFVWLQLGIDAGPAVRRAEAAGLRVVAGRCIKIEYLQAFGGVPRTQIGGG